VVIIQHGTLGSFILGLAAVSQWRQQNAAQRAISHPMPDETPSAGSGACDDRDQRASYHQSDKRFERHFGR